MANRIVGGSSFEQDTVLGDYRPSGAGEDIHHRGWSALNLNRRAGRVAPAAALFWYSGNTLATGKGSLMGYIPVEGELWTWFLAFARDPGWRIHRRKNIHEYEIRRFEEAAGGRAWVGEITPAAPTESDRSDEG